MAYQPALNPYPQPMGIFDTLTPYPQVLTVREKKLSATGDSFEIKDQNGNEPFRVKGKLMSISGRKQVTDMHGNHLFDIVKEHLHIHTTFAIQDPSGKTLMTVKNGFTLLGSKATATFVSTRTGQAESLKMKGNWFDAAADIVDERTNMVVARINRQILNAGELLLGKQTYTLTIAGNVDAALMLAMCICMDEKNNEGGGGFLG